MKDMSPPSEGGLHRVPAVVKAMGPMRQFGQSAGRDH
jgi:hypothetical protein